ncbi:MAG TPA: deoxyribodipyrimidine photolyase, partial [Gammaproteobacteria bacterium]|nr:deoxyribodipyrimidine photolyase [Gammaproteobacteria bacterium]
MNSPIIVWLRQDQRLSDHPAFAAAEAGGRAVIPCYVLDTRDTHMRRPGAASRWWLYHSLAELDHRIRERNGRLLLRHGNPVSVLTELALELQAGAVFFSRAV